MVSLGVETMCGVATYKTFAIGGFRVAISATIMNCDSGAILAGSIATESGPTLSTPKYRVDSEMIPASL